MQASDQQVSVLLKFRGMPAPIAVNVPGHVLQYLDRHAEQSPGPNGTVVYRQPSAARPLPDERASWQATYRTA